MKNREKSGKDPRYGKNGIATRFKPGQSGNPKGKPRLPEEIRALKEEALQKAIELLHQEVTDPNFRKNLNARDRAMFLETAFDRFGLPKVTKTELSGNEGGPLIIEWDDNPKKK